MLPLACLYGFHGAGGTLLEVKRLDLPAGSAPDAVYHWLWQPAGSDGWQKLGFVAMASEPQQYRRFAEGELWFDAAGARLQLGGQQQQLAAGSPDGWQASVSAWLQAQR
ncbi:hypothetical protein [Vogesella sp. LIG4]|uniref:hypothetical protein n=1 Tax=Vogesella sp. LIG4 TaxID=1192162 RepID=UPI000820134A|nr:hypothetical protein [Vogesella sp. LIG4]SCK11157.1 hypothetical protein PSELUDRAFT_0914 [Vogesella sp. LIG4]